MALLLYYIAYKSSGVYVASRLPTMAHLTWEKNNVIEYEHSTKIDAIYLLALLDRLAINWPWKCPEKNPLKIPLKGAMFNGPLIEINPLNGNESSHKNPLNNPWKFP